MKVAAVVATVCIIAFGYLVSASLMLDGAESIILREKSPGSYIEGQCGSPTTQPSDAYTACADEPRMASFVAPGAPELLRGGVILAATLLLTLALVLICRLPVSDEVEAMIGRLRTEFDDPLAEHGIGFSFKTYIAFAPRGFRRDLHVVGGAEHDDDRWQWPLVDVDWIGRRRELTPLTSVEQEVAGVLARYLAGERPPFESEKPSNSV